MAARTLSLQKTAPKAGLWIGSFALLAAGVLFFLSWSILHAHNWAPLRVPLRIDSAEGASGEFVADLETPYEVEFDLRRSMPFEALAKLAPPALDCSVRNDDKPVHLEPFHSMHYTGEYTSFNWSYWGGDHFGFSVGEFHAHRGQRYTVRARVKRGDARLQILDPHLQVVVQPLTMNEVGVVPGGLLAFCAVVVSLLGVCALLSAAIQARRLD